MKLAHCSLENLMTPEAGILTTFVVESPRRLYEYATELSGQTRGEGGGFVLSEGGRVLNLERDAVFIHDLFDFQINSKKTAGLLGKKLASLLTSPDFILKAGEIRASISRLIRDAEFSIGIPLDYSDEADINSIFKSCGVKARENRDGLLDKLVTLVDVLFELEKFSVMFLAFPRAVLTEDELAALVRHCGYKGVAVVALESVCPRGVLPGERRLILDADLCEI